MPTPEPTPAEPASNPNLSAPGVNDIAFSDWQVLGQRTLGCLTCPEHPLFDTVAAFNAHLNALHPTPRRLVCQSQGFACGRRQMGGGGRRR